MSRCSLTPALFAFPFFALPWAAGEELASVLEVSSFVEAHCLSCHDAESTKGGLNLEELLDSPLEGAHAVDRWTLIHDRVAAGEMPPPERESPPSPEESATFLRTLAPPLTEADSHIREVVQRRLNRVEYEATIHDLLGIELPLQQLLPEDQSAGGFDNNGEALAVSAELVGRYLEAARLALDEALPLGDRPIEQTFTTSSFSEIEPYLGEQYGHHDGRFVTYTTEREDYSKISTRETPVPKRGRYRLRFTAATHRGEEPIVFALRAKWWWPREGSAPVGFYEATADPQEFVVEVTLPDQGHVQFFALGLPTWVNDADSSGEPGIGFSETELTGPLHDQWPPESHVRILGETDLGTAGTEEASEIFREFASRAFRRPATDEEVARYTRLVTTQLEGGRPFYESLRLGLEAILCSPQFLTLPEAAPDEGRISDYQLASRLSYFLWSSAPDAALLTRAAEGGLRTPKGLTAEVDRMLADPRSERFVRHFTGQWLLLREINATTPDSRLYPEFDDVLQESMIRECRSFFRKLLDENLRIENFLDSDFAMLNGRLAEHYGIEGVTGLEMRAVPLPPESVRGGVLTQGGVLKVTANGTNTSPVMRGAWVLENILGKHIPPPPPNIGGIEPDIRDATTIREQLDLHRNSESCRTCHQYIDPPGFALEAFDPTGAYRESYSYFKVTNPEEGWGSVEEGKPVDASGELSTGESFQSFAEFKDLLLADSDRFALCLTDRLLTYALGRELGFSDRPALHEIARLAESEGNGLRTLIHHLVTSPTFSAP